MRYTPEIITALKPNEIFVFGSNEAGIHGAGAARFAMDKLGAVFGKGWGLAGQTFAIPTKDWSIETLELAAIGFYINRFVNFAKLHPELTFLVTKIGCGLAGCTVAQIAPQFIYNNAFELKNLVFPKEFVDEYRDWKRRSKLPKFQCVGS